jgi:hypothetical protein
LAEIVHSCSRQDRDTDAREIAVPVGDQLRTALEKPEDRDQKDDITQ